MICGIPVHQSTVMCRIRKPSRTYTLVTLLGIGAAIYVYGVIVVSPDDVNLKPKGEFPAALAHPNSTRKPLCPLPHDITGLGPIPVSKQLEVNKSELIKRNSQVLRGGQWKPSHCTSRHRVAIIVPYKDRDTHLWVFLQHLHKLLQKQLIHYGIYIIEQGRPSTFNRARLLNAGFLEAMKDAANWQCAIFHDVDLLAENTRNLYYCPEQPRHLSVAVDTLGYELLYESQFGGVSGMKVEHFRLLNGYSNLYWGWGGEDDDMAVRIDTKHLKRLRYPPEVARYTMLQHDQDRAADHLSAYYRNELLLTAKYRLRYDGLASTSYTVHGVERAALYTKVDVHFVYDLPTSMLLLQQLNLPRVRDSPNLARGRDLYEEITW